MSTEITKEEFLKLDDLDKLKYVVQESLKDHKGQNTEYWKGSTFMGNSVLGAIEKIKEERAKTEKSTTSK